MGRWILIAAFFVFGALIFQPATARAGMHFCNKTSNTVTVAMATYSGGLFGDSHVWGWWQVAPDGCRMPIGADLDTSGDTDYFYYAFDTTGGRWTGSTSFCIDPSDAFDFNDQQETNCATGAHRNFKSINTHDRVDYTLDLTG